MAGGADENSANYCTVASLLGPQEILTKLDLVMLLSYVPTTALDRGSPWRLDQNMISPAEPYISNP